MKTTYEEQMECHLKKFVEACGQYEFEAEAEHWGKFIRARIEHLKLSEGE